MLLRKDCPNCGGSMDEVITRYVTRNGRRVYPVNCKVFRFFVCGKCKKK